MERLSSGKSFGFFPSTLLYIQYHISIFYFLQESPAEGTKKAPDDRSFPKDRYSSPPLLLANFVIPRKPMSRHAKPVPVPSQPFSVTPATM